MPTVYYTDGTFKKYERYGSHWKDCILKDPYLKLDPRFFIRKHYEQSNYCCSEFEKISETINCSFDDLGA